jgi:two-component system, OmpR family, aerobic respiration control sensor histidine kinase ArcB
MGERQADQSMTLAGVNVLLAEDNPTNQLVAVQMLESLGAAVTLASDGAEALGILCNQSFDVALIDIEMPRISGIDLIRRLRATPGPAEEMPMIALTAYVMREQRAAIQDAGADGIIAKPILSIEKFGDDIIGFMRQRQGRTPRPGSADEARPGPPSPPARPAADIDRKTFDTLWASFKAEERIELKSRVTHDIRGAVVSIRSGVQSRDYGQLRAATHVLIAVAGVIGAQKLQALARRLNSAGHAGDESSLDRDGAELVDEADHVLDFVGRK